MQAFVAVSSYKAQAYMQSCGMSGIL